MRTAKSYHSNLAFLDLLFNMIVGFVFLFVVSYMLINITKADTKIVTKAEFIITLTWDTDNPDDVDLWVEDPEERVLFFRKKEVGLMHLDRDDLGSINDTIITATGVKIVYPFNQEIATIRGFIAGQWVVNVHMFNKRTIEVTNVEVKIEKLNPVVQLIAHEKVQMFSKGEEITMARFLMNPEGIIIEVNNNPKPIIQKYLMKSELGYGLEQ